MGASVTFSFASTKWLERVERKHLRKMAVGRRTMPRGFAWTEKNPARWFNVMVITFFFGLIFFVAALMFRLA